MHKGVGAAALVALFTANSGYAWKENADIYIGETNFVLEDRCSATLISKEKKQVLTAFHCIPKEHFDWIMNGSHDPIKIQQTVYSKGEVFASFTGQAKIIAANEKNDLALLEMVTGNFPFNSEATIASEAPNVGDAVYVVGNPFVWMDNTLTKGILSAKHRIVPSERHVWQIDADTIGGNSGGAIYNEDAELIGVLSGGMAMMGVPVGFNFISPLYQIQELIASVSVE